MGTFGENVEAAMDRRGLPRAELARLLGTSLSQVNKWVGTENVELTTIFRLAKALSVSIESLCEGIDPDYDAMRAKDQSPERFAEVWARLSPDVREALWLTILRVAGVPELDNPAVPA